MTIGVSHTYGGNVVVVDMDTGRRWDLTPEEARAGADRCDAVPVDAAYAGIAVIEALDGRAFRMAGTRDDFAKMARICSGDPLELDHWRDIQGYALLGQQAAERDRGVLRPARSDGQ